MANGVPGQTLHQMYFGFSHSPPSSPSQTAPYSHFWGQTATTPVSHNPVMAPGSPTAHVGGHGLGATSSMPMFTQLPVYAAAHTPQMLTGIIASPFPQHHGMQTVFGADYSMAQAYVS